MQAVDDRLELAQRHRLVRPAGRGNAAGEHAQDDLLGCPAQPRAVDAEDAAAVRLHRSIRLGAVSVGRAVERRAGPLQSPRTRGQHVGGQAEGVERVAGGAQARALERGGLVARILDPGNAAGLQRCAQARLRGVEQRARQPQGAQTRGRRNGGKAVEAAAAGKPHQQRLGLVVEGVGGEECGQPPRACEVAHQPVAGLAGSGLQAGLRLGPRPHEGGVAEAELGGVAGDRLGLGGGLRAQAVVDGEDYVRRRGGAALPQPVRKQHHQSGAVAAPRHGQRHAFTSVRIQEGRKQPVELIGADRVTGGGHDHSAWAGAINAANQ